MWCYDHPALSLFSLTIVWNLIVFWQLFSTAGAIIASSWVMIVVNGLKNGWSSLTETISRSFERRGGSQGKQSQEWPRLAPISTRPFIWVTWLPASAAGPLLSFSTCMSAILSLLKHQSSSVSATVWGHGNDSAWPVTLRHTLLSVVKFLTLFPYPSARLSSSTASFNPSFLLS